MQRVDERVVDNVDLWIVDDFGVCPVNLFDATLCGECLGAGGHGNQPVAEHSCRIDDPVIGNPCGTENADLERAISRRPLLRRQWPRS